MRIALFCSYSIARGHFQFSFINDSVRQTAQSLISVTDTWHSLGEQKLIGLLIVISGSMLAVEPTFYVSRYAVSLSALRQRTTWCHWFSCKGLLSASLSHSLFYFKTLRTLRLSRLRVKTPLLINLMVLAGLAESILIHISRESFFPSLILG